MNLKLKINNSYTKSKKASHIFSFNQINERFGFIEDDKFNILLISKELYSMVNNDNDWKSYYVLPTGNKKQEKGIVFKQLDFNIPYRNMNKIRVVICKFTDEYTFNKNFDSLNGDNDATAFYYPSDSIIDSDNNIGMIYMSYTYFIDSNIKEYEEILSHEIRHYFDNIIGVYSQHPQYTNSSIEHAADLFNIDEESFIKYKNSLDINSPKYKEANLLLNIIYVSDPTEMNAFYHSLIKVIKQYKQKNPDADYNDIKTYMTKDSHLAFDLFNMSFMFLSKDNYKKCLNIIFSDKAEAMYYYFYKTSRINNVRKEAINKYNKLFYKYFDYSIDSLDDLTEEDFKEALHTFLFEHWIRFIYRLSKPKYDRIYLNMLKYIKTISVEK